MRFYRRSCYDALPAASETPKAGDWLESRHLTIRCLRYQTRSIILLLALAEVLKKEPLKLVHAGRQGFPPPGENDYGITYTTAYILSYLYLCAFMVIYIPFFSWIPRLFPSHPASNPTDPNTPAPPTKMEILARWIRAFNMLWLPFCTAICALFYAIVLINVLVYVDERRSGFFQLPKNTKQSWKSRALIVTFIAISIGLGYGAFSVLEMTELARVKTFEYVAIVVPVQINIGIILATVAQRKMEKTAAIKAARREQHVEEQGSLAAGVTDEKMPLTAGE